MLIALLPLLSTASFVVRPFYSLWRKLAKVSPGVPAEGVVEAAKEEIRVAIEDAASEGAIREEQKEMIEGVMEFRDVVVHEIMTPRTDMECMEISTSMAEAVSTILGFNHSRIPLYEKNRDRVVGIVHVKDLLPMANSKDTGDLTLRGVMREPLFVPETQHVGSLLLELKQQHAQMAIILDEYGGVTGLVTIEDIMEEVVGEIEDEFDQEDQENRIRELGPGTLDVDARVRVDEINDLLEIGLPEDEDYDTVGGFVMAQLARVPRVGQEIHYNGVTIRVLDSDKRRVRRLLLTKLGPEEAAGED